MLLSLITNNDLHFVKVMASPSILYDKKVHVCIFPSKKWSSPEVSRLYTTTNRLKFAPILIISFLELIIT